MPENKKVYTYDPEVENLTQHQIQVLMRNGLYPQTSDDPDAQIREISKLETEYDRWRNKLIHRIAARVNVASVVLGPVPFYAYMASSLTTLVLPSIVGIGIVVAASLVASPIMGTTFKFGPSRVGTKLDNHHTDYELRLQKALEKVNANPNNMRAKKKLARVVLKEQKYLKKMYFKSSNMWEHCLKKSDVQNRLRDPGGYNSTSKEYVDFKNWGGIIGSTAHNYNKTIAIIEQYGLKDIKTKCSVERIPLSTHTANEMRVAQKEETKDQNNNLEQVITKKKLAAPTQKSSTKKKALLVEDSLLFKHHDSSTTLKTAPQTDQTIGRRLKTKAKAKVENVLKRRTKSADNTYTQNTSTNINGMGI